MNEHGKAETVGEKLFLSNVNILKIDALLMLYPTETLDLLPPVEQIDAHLKHQKGIFRPRAAEFLKKKAEKKSEKWLV